MTIEQLYKQFLQSAGICTDTRKSAENSLFFALKGDQFDGNLFVEKALEKGCRLAISEREDLRNKENVLVVPSALSLLQELANFHRRQLDARLLAITGSNGKTTTKELLRAVLSKKYRVACTSGNLNNHIGVPLTLLSISTEEVAVIEMGANHPGEIAALAEIAAPTVGMITNVGKAHLEGFGSLAGVLNAKGELYDYLAGHNGLALVDGSDQLLVQKALDSGTDFLKVGSEGEIRLEVKLLKQSPFLEVELILDGEAHPCATRLVGAYNLQNILLAAAAGVHFGVEFSEIAGAISDYLPDNHRSQLVEGGRNRVVLDSYNANPSSMREAIGALLEYAAQPTMLILGDMAELGASSPEEHRSLLEWITTLKVSRVLLVGPKFCDVYEPSEHTTVFRERKALEAFLGEEKPEGYLVLVKGSRVMGLENIAPLL